MTFLRPDPLEDGYRAFRVPPGEEGLRLDRFLHRRLSWLSRSAAARLIREGRVARGGAEGGRALRPSTRVFSGERYSVRLPADPKDAEAARRSPPLLEEEILFEDESVVAVDKRAGVPVHPVGMNLYRTVLTGLRSRALAAGEAPERLPRLVHRLDLETSGVLLAAKGREAARFLTARFREGRVEKEYAALVYGRVEEDAGRIELPLGPEPGARVPYKQAVRREGGRPAVTEYRVLRRGREVTLLLLRPRTGRKHQLRVHLAALGHAVVGDKVYGPDEKYYFQAREGPPGPEALGELLLPRQALHALRLTFPHPRRRRPVTIEAPLPAAFVRLLEGREGDGPGPTPLSPGH